MKHSYRHNIPSLTTTKKRLTATLVVGILFFQPLLFGNIAYAGPSSNLAGQCLSKVTAREGTAFVARTVITAITASISATQVALAVPSSDLGGVSGSSLQSGEGAASTVLKYLQEETDCVVHAASQLMVDNLNTAINNAIRQGLNGVPNYSANTNQFMSSLSNMVSGQLRNQIDVIKLCDFTGNDSFKQNLSKNIGNSARQTNSSAQNFEQKIKCPFPTTGNNTAPAFYNDFSKGGWSSFEGSLSDNGNPFGTTLIAGKELATRQEETARLAKEQLDRGNGYYPVVDESTCEYPEGLKAFLDTEGDQDSIANAQRLYCKVTTPGKTVADSASKAATSAWDQLNVSGAMGKTMDGFNAEQAANAMKGIF